MRELSPADEVLENKFENVEEDTSFYAENMGGASLGKIQVTSGYVSVRDSHALASHSIVSAKLYGTVVSRDLHSLFCYPILEENVDLKLLHCLRII